VGCRPALRAGRQLKLYVRIFFKKGSDFIQKTPPVKMFLILGDYGLAPPAAGLGII